MKVKELLDLLKTNYLVIADKDNEYQVNYVTKYDLTPEILSSSVASIEPVTFLRKQLFDGNAEEGDYVSAIKFLYDLSDRDEKIEEEAYSRQTSQKKEEQSAPNFGFGGIPPFFAGSDIFGSLLTPDVIDQITSSELFQSLMDPENIQEIINSDDFKNFVNNADLSQFTPNFDFLQNLKDTIGNSRQNDVFDDEYEEYEEFDDFDDDYEDDDEYEEI